MKAIRPPPRRGQAKPFISPWRSEQASEASDRSFFAPPLQGGRNEFFTPPTQGYLWVSPLVSPGENCRVSSPLPGGGKRGILLPPSWERKVFVLSSHLEGKTGNHPPQGRSESLSSLLPGENYRVFIPPRQEDCSWVFSPRGTPPQGRM